MESELDKKKLLPDRNIASAISRNQILPSRHMPCYKCSGVPLGYLDRNQFYNIAYFLY